jgi:hypothetical protein
MNAKRDQNGIPTLIAALNTDGTTIVNVRVNPTNHGLKVNDDTTGSDFGPVNALRDENSVCIGMGVSSADLVTPVPIYATSAGSLLINSN